MTDAALRLKKEYPDARFIVHYLQPHGPLVGYEVDAPRKVLAALDAGEITKDTARKAYRECLEYAFSEVERLVSHLDGSVVVTADHGEAFGEAGVIAHPPWADMDVLLQVPRIEIEGGDEPIPDEVGERNEFDIEASVEDRLEHLGYKDSSDGR